MNKIISLAALFLLAPSSYAAENIVLNDPIDGMTIQLEPQHKLVSVTPQVYGVGNNFREQLYILSVKDELNIPKCYTYTKVSDSEDHSWSIKICDGFN